MGIFDRLGRLLKSPLADDRDLLDFVLLVALFLIVAWLWSRVVRTITE